MHCILIKCRCNGLALPGGRKQSRAQQRGWEVVAALLCVGHEALPQHTDNIFLEESGEGRSTKKEETLSGHSIALLAYGKKEAFLLIPHKKNHVWFLLWIQNPCRKKRKPILLHLWPGRSYRLCPGRSMHILPDIAKKCFPMNLSHTQWSGVSLFWCSFESLQYYHGFITVKKKKKLVQT